MLPATFLAGSIRMLPATFLAGSIGIMEQHSIGIYEYVFTEIINGSFLNVWTVGETLITICNKRNTAKALCYTFD